METPILLPNGMCLTTSYQIRQYYQTVFDLKNAQHLYQHSFVKNIGFAIRYSTQCGPFHPPPNRPHRNCTFVSLSLHHRRMVSQVKRKNLVVHSIVVDYYYFPYCFPSAIVLFDIVSVPHEHDRFWIADKTIPY
jgi:hypothetical protein